LTNIDGMNESDLYYPANQMVRNNNVITMVGWTIYDLNTLNYDHIRRTLENLNSYNKPMLIRFANEMNVSELGNEPDVYVQVFRQIADMIHEYPNLAVVWSPCDLGALDRGFEYYYPGDEYVDWVGVSDYMLKYFMGNPNAELKSKVYFMTDEYAWATNKLKPIIEFMEENNIQKPVMISEGGVATNNKFGEDYQSWTAPRLRNMLWYTMMKYPQIKMVNYFDVYRADEVERYNISSYPYAVDIFNEAKNSGAYIPEYGKNAEFVFKPANDAGRLVAEDNAVTLYTLAHVVGYPDITVNYYIDGNWYHCSSQIPYSCNMYMSDLTDGIHTLKIETIGMTKEYTFCKNGNVIAFGNEAYVLNSEPPQPEEIAVVMYGEKMLFENSPVIKNDRVLVPMRAIFEALGASVDWEDSTQTVYATRDDLKVVISIGNNALNVNGQIVELDVSAQLIDDKTYVPVRAVSEAFGCTVVWDDASKTVIIE